jgi:hypothetical protein
VLIALPAPKVLHALINLTSIYSVSRSIYAFINIVVGNRLRTVILYNGPCASIAKAVSLLLTSAAAAPLPNVYTTLLTSNPLNWLAAQRVYAPMLSNPSQSPTRSPEGSSVFGHTQSIESQVGPHTLLVLTGSEAGTWNEPFIDNT